MRVLQLIRDAMVKVCPRSQDKTRQETVVVVVRILMMNQMMMLMSNVAITNGVVT